MHVNLSSKTQNAVNNHSTLLRKHIINARREIQRLKSKIK